MQSTVSLVSHFLYLLMEPAASSLVEMAEVVGGPARMALFHAGLSLAVRCLELQLLEAEKTLRDEYHVNSGQAAACKVHGCFATACSESGKNRYWWLTTLSLKGLLRQDNILPMYWQLLTFSCFYL